MAFSYLDLKAHHELVASALHLICSPFAMWAKHEGKRGALVIRAEVVVLRMPRRGPRQSDTNNRCLPCSRAGLERTSGSISSDSQLKTNTWPRQLGLLVDSNWGVIRAASTASKKGSSEGEAEGDLDSHITSLSAAFPLNQSCHFAANRQQNYRVEAWKSRLNRFGRCR